MKGLEMDLSSLEKIMERVPNRYEAIRIMAKEAQRINRLLLAANEELADKPTTIAMKRLINGKVKYSYGKQEEEK
jgi:DNA-directed RNA polymerase omega subunit